MYDCCVARERLRIIMSSIMRWRRGLVVPIGGPPVMRGGGCDDHILSDGRLHLSPFPPAPKEQVRSIPGRIASEFALKRAQNLGYQTNRWRLVTRKRPLDSHLLM